MVEIEQGYKTLFAELAKFPTLKVICYGYDYPRPLVKGGTYIGRHLRKKGIPDDRMGAISAALIDRLNETIQRATQFTQVRYLDCRRLTESYTWYDDIHPDRDGFFALAVKFEEAMT